PRLCGHGEQVDATARFYLCAGCRAQVLICSCCDHGNIYCGDECASAARRSARACLQQRQTLSPPPSPFGVAAPRSAYRRSDQRPPARKGALQRQMASNSGLLDQREPSVTATDRHDITIDGPWRQLCAGPQNRRQTALLAVSAHGLLAPTTRS